MTPLPAPPAPAPAGWIVSPAYDLAWFIAPALVTAVAALLLPADAALGLAGWLVLVVLVDVAHTWATLYRTWLDPELRAERPGLLWGTPLLAFSGAVLVHAVATPWFWTVLAYVAVFHFVRQQQGFAALYRARAGVPFASVEARVEHWTVAALCAYPVVWWHAHLPRAFAWFTPTDFVPLPAWVLGPAGIVTALLFAAWVGLRARARLAGRGGAAGHAGAVGHAGAAGHAGRADKSAPPEPPRGGWGRDLWVLSTGATWFAGIVLTNGDAAFTLANVVAHGVPYFALVHHVGRRQWADTPEDGARVGPLAPGWFAPAALVAFLALPMLAALLEELAWDALVWREHVFAPADLPAWIAAIAVPLLVTPQLTHYLLDGFIWKLGPPGSPLRRRLLG